MDDSIEQTTSNLPNGKSCLILGGGAVGLNLAFELSKRGRSVRVLDQSKMGSGASWAGAGILAACGFEKCDDPLDQLRGLSHRIHATLAIELKELTGIDTGFRRCGGLYLARTAAESATLAAQRILWDEHEVEAHQWTLDQAADVEPALQPLVRSGTIKAVWHLPDECQVRNPWHVQALLAACKKLGAQLNEDIHVQRIDRTTDGRPKAVTDQGEYEADQICICCGAWTRLVLDRMSVPTGIMPVRGQIVLYHTGTPLLKQIINEGHRYLVPREDGRLLVGSCEEEAGYQIQTTEPKMTELRVWAESILPQLKTATIEKTWAGLRPGSFDGMPYMGKVPQFSNVYVAAGHYRSGIHLSCATAVMMADLMDGKPTAIDLSAFRIARG
jgi:glycine oxidase